MVGGAGAVCALQTQAACVSVCSPKYTGDPSAGNVCKVRKGLFFLFLFSSKERENFLLKK